MMSNPHKKMDQELKDLLLKDRWLPALLQSRADQSPNYLLQMSKQNPEQLAESLLNDLQQAHRLHHDLLQKKVPGTEAEDQAFQMLTQPETRPPRDPAESDLDDSELQKVMLALKSL